MAAPPFTGSEPPSQKSFCTSTMISALFMASPPRPGIPRGKLPRRPGNISERPRRFPVTPRAHTGGLDTVHVEEGAGSGSVGDFGGDRGVATGELERRGGQLREGSLVPGPGLGEGLAADDLTVAYQRRQ